MQINDGFFVLALIFVFSLCSLLSQFWNLKSSKYDLIRKRVPTLEELILNDSVYLDNFIKRMVQGESIGCTSCKNFLPTVKKASHNSFLRPIVFNVALDICRFKGFSKEVCDGSIDIYAPWLFKVLDEIELDDKKNPYISQLLCYSLNHMCPYPDNLKPNQLKFPKPITHTETKRKKPKRKLRMLQISDIHLDLKYLQGAEADCGRPICCQASSSNSREIKRPASSWGDYNCDMPKPLLISMLRYIRLHVPSIDMIIFTGDIPGHDVWKLTVEDSIETELSAFGLMGKYLNPLKIPIIPAIGNHEAVPANNFPTSKNLPLYSKLADMWKQWLPKKALAKLRRNGVYSFEPFPGLKVISLNTNLCYVLNFWLVSSITSDGQDPDSILHWLIQELQEAEIRQIKVYILGHIPPSHPDCFRYWSDRFHQIVNRYHKVIAGQFYGHTHFDEFQITYQSDTVKDASSAIGVSYIAPSATTFSGLNPGFRVYDIDTTTYQVDDTYTYVADLNRSIITGFEPDWQLEYRARSFFLPRPATGQPLHPSWWHNVSLSLEKDDDQLQAYYQTMFKGSRPNLTCHALCRTILLQNMRASNASQASDSIEPIYRH